MVTIITRINKEKAWEIRHEVMWPEKSFDYIKLEDDELGIHFGLFKGHKLTSVISLFIENEAAQFRKFATIEQEQGKGYGTTLLDFLMKEAKNHGVKRIWCNARENKKSFYNRFGLEETKNRFTKGGKSYVIMEKYL